MKSRDFPPRWCGAACGADVIRQKLRGANTHRNTHVYMLHKHIYRCTLSLHQTHNSLVLCQRYEGNRLSFYRVSNFICTRQPFCDSVFSVGLRWRMGVCALLPS